MEALNKSLPTIDYLRQLEQAGITDATLLRRETAERVLTEKRMELLREIAGGEEITSMRDLARRVDRDISRVSKDLEILSKANIIEYEQKGNSKRPVLKHSNVFVKPVVYEGEVMTE